MTNPVRDYSTVTETPGDRVTLEAAGMIMTRYEQAARHSVGRDVLEVACGSGQGLGYLAARARRVVGGDLTHGLLTRARSHYGDRIPLLLFDGERMPFAGGSFDTVVCFEALYYMNSPDAFVRESRRVLRRGGTIVVSGVNPEWRDYNPSPLSHAYRSASELRQLLAPCFDDIQLLGAFDASPAGAASRAVSALKRTAVKSGLMPTTMSGKRLLKRLFLGQLVSVPPEITPQFAPAAEPEPVTGRDSSTFKILYAIGTVPSTTC